MTKNALTFKNINIDKIKMLEESKIILEFNRKDIDILMQESDSFTIAYEIELEEISKGNNKKSSKDLDDRYEQMFSALQKGKFNKKDFEDFYDDDHDQYDQYDEYDYDKEYGSYISSYQDSYSGRSDIDRSEEYFAFTEDEIISEFPNFFKKWGSEVFIKPDITLDKGFEIVPNKYFSSIDESFNFIEDFFSDYYNQNRFELNSNTGWHINIGVSGRNLGRENLFKGAVLLSDEFATKDFPQRLKTEFSKPIKDYLISKVKDNYGYGTDNESLMRSVLSSNIESIEKVGNEFLLSTGTTTKEFGFNPRGRYVEFRYPGGKLTPDQIKDATLYYCYIIKTIVDPSFKRKEYIKKLYKLLFDGEGNVK